MSIGQNSLNFMLKVDSFLLYANDTSLELFFFLTTLTLVTDAVYGPVQGKKGTLLNNALITPFLMSVCFWSIVTSTLEVFI